MKCKCIDVVVFNIALLGLLLGTHLLGRRGGYIRDHSMYIYSVYTCFTDNTYFKIS